MGRRGSVSAGWPFSADARSESTRATEMVSVFVSSFSADMVAVVGVGITCAGWVWGEGTRLSTPLECETEAIIRDLEGRPD
jgi:hypothetical protein